ncbi:MAG: endonuclease/exonuclease/phosphatase family protein [Verrucomicrobiota bacterium]|nr:endonuclease/exonuclease/phosphatase family protein [Verrucomicrobiota bacterium]
MQLSIMTWNLWADDMPGARWRDRAPYILAFLQSEPVDVIGFQEVTRERIEDIHKHMPQYTWAGEGREGGEQGEYNPIFYRHDLFECLEQKTFWLSQSPLIPSHSWDSIYPRICTVCRLRLRAEGEGPVLAVMNTHLDHWGYRARRESAQILRGYAGTLPVEEAMILMGDFNCGINTEPLQKILADNFFQDLATTGHTQKTWRGWYGTGIGSARLDLIMGRHLRATEYGIRHPGPVKRSSDHFPVVADVESGQ